MKTPRRLKLQTTIEGRPIAPFAFDATFHKPDHFTTGDNYWEPGARWQAFGWRGKRLGVKFSNKGMVARPLVEIKIYAAEK